MKDPDLADMPEPGTILAGKYEVKGLLGKGGMGLVLEARHLRLGQDVALKLLLPSVRATEETVHRFEREARAAARLQSAHVVRIIDVDVLPGGGPFMVMELLKGKELADEIKARGQLPIPEAVGYILQACAAMSVAHRMGIVHRDLKPSNLFLSESEGQQTVKVFDFGISKLAGDVAPAVTATTSAFGTPLYMSPEQVRSVKHVDARTDIWSLGVILYEMLAGTPPFKEPSATAILVAIATDTPTPIRKLRPEVPAPLANAVMRALEKDPDARYADVRELAAAIRPYGPPADHPSMAAVGRELAMLSGEFTRPPVDSGARDRRTKIAIGAGVAVGVIAGVILFASRSPDPSSEPALPASEPPAAVVSAAPAAVPTAGTAAAPVEPTAAPRPSAEPPRPAGTPAAATSQPKPKPSKPEPETTAKPPPPKPEVDPKYL